MQLRQKEHLLCCFSVHQNCTTRRYYAWDYRVLRTFARDETTGDPIPEKLVQAMNGARNMFAATELQRQVYCSLPFLILFYFTYINGMNLFHF